MSEKTEQDMKTIIEISIGEDITFNNDSLFAEMGGQITTSVSFDNGEYADIRPGQLELINSLMSENEIIPSQRAEFTRLAWERLVEIKKTR